MADALCGPSNALQQFKQHTNFDRSLQQDRLTSRNSPSQGFRSHNPNANLLDPEFEAFQAGVPLAELPQYHQIPQQFHPASSASSSAAPAWAADFQRMQISAPEPFQQHQRVGLPAPATSTWAQGFQQHIAQSTPRSQTAVTSPQAFQYQARHGGLTGFQSNFASAAYAPSLPMNVGKGKEAVLPAFDDAAFEQAFEQARADMMADSEVLSTDALAEAADLSSALNAESVALEDALHATPKQPLADLLAETPIQQEAPERHLDVIQEEARTQQQEDDELAATAQELLEKVKDNHTDKFRNSQFLSLMRKLRDFEVKVEGDKMVETTSVASASSTAVAGETAHGLNADRAAKAAAFNETRRFDNSEQRPAPLLSSVAEPVLMPGAVDIRPAEYETSIPVYEQDHDAGRVDPRDGQDVVDLLSRPGPVTDDVGMSSPASFAPRGPFYGDVRPTSASSLSDMLGSGGTLLSNFGRR